MVVSPLPSTAVYIPGRRGRHTNGNGVLFYPLYDTRDETRPYISAPTGGERHLALLYARLTPHLSQMANSDKYKLWAETLY